MKNKKVTIVIIGVMLLGGLTLYALGADPALVERTIKVKKFQNLKSAKFDYYGKVMDQHGDPVIGAKVKGYYTYYPFIPNGDFSSSTENIEITTDEQGLFSFINQTGRSISINSIEKQDYEFEAGRTYIFSRGGMKMLEAIGNPDKPVIFHAWKKTKAEPLYYGEIFQKLPQDGKYHSINIPALDKTMKVSFTIDPSGTSSNPLDWSVNLKVEGGGVFETADLFMNEAPVEGYFSQWGVSYKKSDPKFSEWGGKRKFYIKGLGGPIYGRMEVEFIAYYRNVGVVDAKYWINPKGSRNLQFDPSMIIYPER